MFVPNFPGSAIARQKSCAPLQRPLAIFWVYRSMRIANGNQERAFSKVCPSGSQPPLPRITLAPSGLLAPFGGGRSSAFAKAGIFSGAFFGLDCPRFLAASKGVCRKNHRRTGQFPFHSGGRYMTKENAKGSGNYYRIPGGAGDLVCFWANQSPARIRKNSPPESTRLPLHRVTRIYLCP